MTYNTTHPELWKGEKFLSNINEEGFRRLGWNTKRRGVVPFDVCGNVLRCSDVFPVFVQKEEYDANRKRMGLAK